MAAHHISDRHPATTSTSPVPPRPSSSAGPGVSCPQKEVVDTTTGTCRGPSHTPHTANAERQLRAGSSKAFRILDDGKGRIRTGPEITTLLQRFAIGVITTHGKTVAATHR